MAIPRGAPPSRIGDPRLRGWEPRSLRDVVRCRAGPESCDQRPAAEAEEAEEEAGRRKRDRQAEHDLDKAPEAAAALAERQSEAGDDDDDNGDDLRDRTLDRFQHLLQWLLTGHARPRRLRGRGDREGQADGGANEKARTAGWNLGKLHDHSPWGLADKRRSASA